MKRPACKHRWGKKAAKQRIEDSMRNKRWWGPVIGTNDSSRSEVGRKQTTEVGQYLDCPYATSHSGSYSRHHDSPRTVPTKAAPAPRPPQATEILGTGATHCTAVLAGRNRPMCRAMEWCGRTPSSFAKSPAECSCIWAEYKCGQSKNVGSDSAQTEAFNRGLQPDKQSVLLEQNDLVAFGKRGPEDHPRGESRPGIATVGHR